MRILILDTNVGYIVPTARVLLAALTHEADVVFGGIGYTTDTSYLRALERHTGRFDVIIGQTWMFGKPGEGQYGAFVPRDLHDHPAPKVLNLLQVDPYAISEHIYERCIKPAHAVLTTVTSPQFGIPDPCGASERESWFSTDLFMVRRPDLINEQWLMLPHCIADREFVPLNTVLKHWDVIVPGASYHFRRRVKDYLATCKDARLASLDGFLQRFLYWATTDYRAQRIVDLTGWTHRRFRERIAASRIAVTCDGSIGYALRKFFEIPAFGTLLVARFFPGMHALGFRDGENCFAIRDDSLDRLAEIIDFAKSDSCEVKKIVRAGQEMVREFHSVQVRARQLLALLEALCNKKLAGTRWQDGQQIILAPSVKAAS